jgi:hypothetical protein
MRHALPKQEQRTKRPRHCNASDRLCPKQKRSGAHQESATQTARRQSVWHGRMSAPDEPAEETRTCKEAAVLPIAAYQTEDAPQGLTPKLSGRGGHDGRIVTSSPRSA